MFWAIASSVFVIYLYRKLNTQSAPQPEATETLESELAALNAQISALESKATVMHGGGVTP